MCYGQDITGVADSMLKTQQRVINKAASAPGAGKNLATSLWLHDVAGGKTDPAYDAHELPVLNYAKACLEDWLPKDIISTAHEDAKSKLFEAEGKWNAVTGPFAAVIKTVERLGWSFHDAFRARH